MKKTGPLYWLMVNDRDMPDGFRWHHEPSVWLFVVVNALWGLACNVVNQTYFIGKDSRTPDIA